MGTESLIDKLKEQRDLPGNVPMYWRNAMDKAIAIVRQYATDEMVKQYPAPQFTDGTPWREVKAEYGLDNAIYTAKKGFDAAPLKTSDNNATDNGDSMGCEESGSMAVRSLEILVPKHHKYCSTIAVPVEECAVCSDIRLDKQLREELVSAIRHWGEESPNAMVDEVILPIIARYYGTNPDTLISATEPVMGKVSLEKCAKDYFLKQGGEEQDWDELETNHRNVYRRLVQDVFDIAGVTNVY